MTVQRRTVPEITVLGGQYRRLLYWEDSTGDYCTGDDCAEEDCTGEECTVWTTGGGLQGDVYTMFNII